MRKKICFLLFKSFNFNGYFLVINKKKLQVEDMTKLSVKKPNRKYPKTLGSACIGQGRREQVLKDAIAYLWALKSRGQELSKDI